MALHPLKIRHCAAILGDFVFFGRFRTFVAETVHSALVFDKYLSTDCLKTHPFQLFPFLKYFSH